ncbi:hypothetical protein MMA231_00975 [Asticcacaulis sp. MM231]|uniref:DUF2635 domain-containing protein n=1 Tax=Asticcacaulis sp. MM231 TaxID=3157666 RepID=UPI0032D5A163
MARTYLKPNDGLNIPSPDHGGKPLPAEGGWVETSIYWANRLADRDVVDDSEAQIEREAAEEAATRKASKTAKES